MPSFDSGSTSMRMLSIRLAMPLLGILLWVISTHAGTFAEASFLPSMPTGSDQTFIHKTNKNLHKKLANIKMTSKDLNTSINFANGVVNSLKRLETNLDWSDIHVQQGTPAHGLYVSFAPEKEAMHRGKDALIGLKATVHLRNSFCSKHSLNSEECDQLIQSHSFHDTNLAKSCENLNKKCTLEELRYPYRSINGSCNNVLNGARGESFTGYNRLLPAEYLDGVHEPRRANNKHKLPSPRLISTTMARHEGPENKVTLALMQWGQFIEHDLTRTATSVMIHTENTIVCCGNEGENLSPRYIHPFCHPISVPFDDPFYSQHSVDCMTYVRSVPVIRNDCSLGPMEQMNQATHFMDASQIYGSTFRKSTFLRSFEKGQLEMSTYQNRKFLPYSDNPKEDCEQKQNSACFRSGDSRVNFQPQLTAMYTIWYREHNRIAEKLSELNPHWDDEILFQEARRIVVAEIQHITYHEWARDLLGPKYVKKIDKYGNYNENFDPAVLNSFATAAIRSILTLVDGKIQLYDENRLVNSSLKLLNLYQKPDLIEESNALDSIIRGLATQKSQKYDTDFDQDLANNLYNNGQFGYDILSLDIQRGRDHGLPSYTTFRRLCGMSAIKNFDDFQNMMNQQQIMALKKVYSHPNDVDLIVGGLMEKPVGNALLGPTFSCIIGEQLLRTRRGDRFFYTNSNQPKPFTRQQLNEIEKTTLARVFCDNSDNIRMMQPNVYEKISQNNNLVTCDSSRIPKVNLNAWIDKNKYSH